MKKYIPFAVAIALAVIVVVADRVLDAAPGVIYALIGLFAGLLIVGGPLYAFGIKTFESGDPVRSQVAAVGADNGDQRSPPTERNAALVSEGLQECKLVRDHPVWIAAHGTREIRIDRVEDSLEAFDVHRAPA